MIQKGRVGGVVKFNKMWIVGKKNEWKMFSDLFWNLEDFPSWQLGAAAVEGLHQVGGGRHNI